MTDLTASDGVRRTYYNRPVIKAPHWRWLVIFYFFLGGITGASYTLATLVSLFSKDSAVERIARHVSFAALLPCPPLLVLDLGRPERALNMLRVVKLRSPMSLGSWALAGLGIFASLSSGLHFLAQIRNRDVPRRVHQVIGVLGLPFSVFISGYTGVLLAATNVPIWWHAFPFVSSTFVSSAYSTSLATMSLLAGRGGQEDTEHRLARAEAIALSAELTTLSLALIRLGRFGRPLWAGRLGMIFWPVTYFGGIVLPLILQLSGPARGKHVSGNRRTVAAVLALIGGFSLRALMIFAGRESARRPEDYFAMTRTPMGDR